MVYVLDSSQKLVSVMKEYDISLSSSNTKTENMIYYTFEHTEEADLLSSVTLTAPANYGDSKYLVEGNYIIFQDYDYIWQMFEINGITDTHSETDGAVREVYAEHIIMEVLDDIITDQSVVMGSPSSAMLKALSGSVWEL